MEPEDAFAEWQAEWEFTSEKVQLMRSLFDKRMTYPKVLLEDWELKLLLRDGYDGLDLSRDLLNQIGIMIP